MATTSTKLDVFYPESDGKPMAESRIHREAMTDLIDGLEDWYAADPLAYVSGNEFIYFVEGQPKRNVSPDVWVVRGVDKTILRPSYKTWLEGGKGPEVVVEVTSPSTRREDKGKKFRIYQDDLKVHEYFLFDPLKEYLDPVLQGYRLDSGEYRRIEPVAGRLPSEVLGLHLEADGHVVRLFNPATGRRLLNRLERIERGKEARRDAQAEADREKQARREAQAEADREKEARRDAQAEADREKEARLAAEAELARLRQEIEALRAVPKPKPKRK